MNNLISRSSFLLCLFYFLSHFLMLLNNGVFWDDWTVFNMDYNGIEEAYIDNGMFFPTYIYNTLNKLPHTVFFYHSISFLFGLAILFLFIKILKDFHYFNESQILILGLFFATTPLFHTRILLVSLQYEVAIISFLCSFILLSKLNTSNFTGIRIIVPILFLFSFLINSLLVFYIPVQIYIATKFYKNNFLNLIKKIDLLLLPFIFWGLKSKFLPLSGLHSIEGYNVVTLNGLIKSPWGILLSFKYTFFETVAKIFSVPASHYFIPVIIGTFLIMWLIKKQDFSNMPSISLFKYNLSYPYVLLLIGVILFVSSAFAYIVVGKLPLYNNFNARNQVLLPFAFSFLFVGIVQLMAINQWKYVLYSFLLSGCILININKHIDYIRDSNRQQSIIENLKGVDLSNAFTILVLDSTSKYIESETSQVVYTGIAKLVTGNQKHLLISANKYAELIKSNGSLEKLKLAQGALSIVDWIPSQFTHQLIIANGQMDIKPVSTTLKLLYMQYFEPEEFKLQIKKGTRVILSQL